MEYIAQYYRTKNKELREKAKIVLFVLGIVATLLLSLQLWPDDPQTQRTTTTNVSVSLSSVSSL